MVNRKRLDPTESAAALFGAKLRKFRDKAGLSQAQLADAVGYSNDTISKVETAAQAPSPALAERLDAHFETDDAFQELQPLAAAVAGLGGRIKAGEVDGWSSLSGLLDFKWA